MLCQGSCCSPHSRIALLGQCLCSVPSRGPPGPSHLFHSGLLPAPTVLLWGRFRTAIWLRPPLLHPTNIGLGETAAFATEPTVVVAMAVVVEATYICIPFNSISATQYNVGWSKQAHSMAAAAGATAQPADFFLVLIFSSAWSFPVPLLRADWSHSPPLSKLHLERRPLARSADPSPSAVSSTLLPPSSLPPSLPPSSLPPSLPPPPPHSLPLQTLSLLPHSFMP